MGFKKGEEIEVLKKDGDWWSGRIGPNRTGNFPFNYVKVPEKMDDSDPLAQARIHGRSISNAKADKIILNKGI